MAKSFLSSKIPELQQVDNFAAIQEGFPFPFIRSMKVFFCKAAMCSTEVYVQQHIHVLYMYVPMCSKMHVHVSMYNNTPTYFMYQCIAKCMFMFQCTTYPCAVCTNVWQDTCSCINVQHTMYCMYQCIGRCMFMFQ